MKVNTSSGGARRTWVVVVSLLLYLVAIPHVLEDFALGEPAKNGVAEPVLAAVVAGLFAGQGLALFYLGQNQRRGYWILAALGVVWPLAAGVAQLPVILTTQPYRAGLISLHYVIGMIGLGLLLLVTSVRALRTPRPPEK